MICAIVRSRVNPVTLINRKTDYATRILLHLARLPAGSWTTSGAVARDQLIPQRLIGQIVSMLAKAGLVITKRGKGGGVRMARAAAQISLLDVVEAMQGTPSLNLCIGEPARCRMVGRCPMDRAWARCEEGLAEGLRRETLDQLVNLDSGLPTS